MFEGQSGGRQRAGERWGWVEGQKGIEEFGEGEVVGREGASWAACL